MSLKNNIIKSEEFKKMFFMYYLVLSLPYTGNHIKFKK